MELRICLHIMPPRRMFLALWIRGRFQIAQIDFRIRLGASCLWYLRLAAQSSITWPAHISYSIFPIGPMPQSGDQQHYEALRAQETGRLQSTSRQLATGTV